jgi:hypothetical protein
MRRVRLAVSAVSGHTSPGHTSPGHTSPAHAAPARTASGRLPASAWHPPLLRLAVPLLVVVVGCISASLGDQSRIGPWGLIQALPPLYFLSLVLVSVSFFRELGGGDRASPLVLATHLVGLVLLLHGAPGFLEQEPRFATAWLHAGFTDQILQHGVARPTVDARFDWPGFFGAAAAVTGAAGLTSPLALLRWAPVAVVLLYLPSLYVIGRQLTGSVRATWLGLWMFVLVNWVGQDYFAPQALGFVLYLAAVAILVTFFRQGRQLPLTARVTRWRDRLPYDGLPDLAAGPRTRVALVVLLVLLTAAVAVSHQLTPIGLVLVSSALIVAGRLRLLAFPVIAGVLTLGWISVGTTPYWIGHLQVIFGGLGHVGAVVDNSVGQRVLGSPVHLALVKLRLLYTAAVWSLMALSALVLWVRGRLPLTLLALGGAPLVTLVQNYGNEGVLRVFLFSSPFASLIVAQLLVTWMPRRVVQVVVAAVAIALVPLFLVTRYGNESFEQVRGDEVHAVRVLYRLAPLGSTLISPTTQVPWRFEFAADYDYVRPVDEEGFRSGNRRAVRFPLGVGVQNPVGTYLLITTGQALYASESLGSSPTWFQDLRPKLNPSNGYHLLYQNRDALVYRYRAPR